MQANYCLILKKKKRLAIKQVPSLTCKNTKYFLALPAKICNNNVIWLDADFVSIRFSASH